MQCLLKCLKVLNLNMLILTLMGSKMPNQQTTLEICVYPTARQQIFKWWTILNWWDANFSVSIVCTGTIKRDARRPIWREEVLWPPYLNWIKIPLMVKSSLKHILFENSNNLLCLFQLFTFIFQSSIMNFKMNLIHIF